MARFAPVSYTHLDVYKRQAHHRSVQFTRPVREGTVAPDLQFQFRLAAVACGLGEIGYSKMLLTPQFGPCLLYTSRCV